MTTQEALHVLEALGSEKTRQTYRRHSIDGDQYGVSIGNLKTLKKQIKTDHDLALSLWTTGNHDARYLATMIADPQQIDMDTLDIWSLDLSNYVITDAFSTFIAQTPHARELMALWTTSEDEWLGRAGWSLLASLAMNDNALPDTFFSPYLSSIERDIHVQKNRVRDAMNNALIAIGSRNHLLKGQAMAIAAKMGQVQVDHGNTACKTPDAAAYIEKMWARKQT